MPPKASKKPSKGPGAPQAPGSARPSTRQAISGVASARPSGQTHPDTRKRKDEMAAKYNKPESMNPPAESSSGAGAGAIAPNPPASPSTTSTAPDSPAKPTQPAKKSLSREQLKDAGLGGDDEEDDLTETEDEDTGGTAKVKKNPTTIPAKSADHETEAEVDHPVTATPANVTHGTSEVEVDVTLGATTSNLVHTPFPSINPSEAQSADQGEDPTEDESLGVLKAALADLPPSKFLIVGRKGKGGYRPNPIDPDTKAKMIKFGLKPIPCHRDDVPEKKKPQPDNTPKDDSVTKFVHSTSHHVTIAKAVVLCPFDILACLPFHRALHAQGVSFANSFPTREIIDEGLAALLGVNGQEYAKYLTQAKAYKQQLSQEEAAGRPVETEEDKAKGKSADVRLSDKVFDRPFDERFGQYPLVDLDPPKKGNQAANAEKGKKAKAKSKKGKESAKGKEREVTPADSELMPPPENENLFGDLDGDDTVFDNLSINEADVDDDGTKVDLSRVVPSEYAQSILYGTSNPISYPPPVMTFYGRMFKGVVNTFNNSFYRILRDANVLQSQSSPKSRATMLQDKLEAKIKSRYGDQYEFAAMRECFGDWAVVEIDGQLAPAKGPPGRPIIPGYEARIGHFLGSLRTFVARNDKTALANILKLDEKVTGAIGRFRNYYEAKKVPRKNIAGLVELFGGLLHSYKRLQAEPSMLFTRYATVLWKAAAEFDKMDPQVLAGLPAEEQEVISAIQQQVAQVEQTTAAIDNDAIEAEANSEGYALALGAKVSHGTDDEDEEEQVTTDSVMTAPDYGVDFFARWDAWDFVIYFGIVREQDAAAIKLVDEMSRDTAHEREMDSEGKPKVDATGQYIWKNPRHHRARLEIVIPGLNRWETEPINRSDWEVEQSAAAEKGETAQRTSQNHRRIVPSVHQLAGLANLLARGYLDPKYAPHHSGTILCDDVGVGKTLQGLMASVMIDYYDRNRGYFRDQPAPVQAPWKKHWCYSARDAEHGTKEPTDEEIRAMPTRWIGDRNAEDYRNRHRSPLSYNNPLKISLFISTATVIASTAAEARRFLDPTKFLVLPFTSEMKRSPRQSLEFRDEIAKNSSSKHIILLLAYSTMSTVAKDASLIVDSHNQAAALNDSLLKVDWVWSFMFVDEIHALRNPNAQMTINLQRFATKALVTCGATATPIWNSPLDILFLLMALLHTAVIETVTTGDGKKGGEWSNLVDTVQTNWKRLQKARNDRVNARDIERTKAIKTLTGDAKAEKIAERDEEKLKWFGGEEDPETAKTPEEHEEIVFRNTWRANLKSEVVDLVISIASPYLIRRTAMSKDYLGDLVIPNSVYADKVVQVELTQSEQDAQKAFKDAQDQSSALNFQVSLRQYSLDPNYVQERFVDLSSAPSAKMRATLKVLRTLDLGNYVEPPSLRVPFPAKRPIKEQTKVVIHTIWTSLIPVLQARLYQYGFHAAVISGNTLPEKRPMINEAFQLDEDHMSTPFILTLPEGKVTFIPPTPCRIIIITSVASAGINLFRANTMIMLDLSFTRQEEVQIIGRINRQGQTRDVTVYKIVMVNETDQWLGGISGTKGLAANQMLGSRKPDVITLKPQSDDTTAEDDDKDVEYTGVGVLPTSVRVKAEHQESRQVLSGQRKAKQQAGLTKMAKSDKEKAAKKESKPRKPKRDSATDAPDDELMDTQLIRYDENFHQANTPTLLQDDSPLKHRGTKRKGTDLVPKGKRARDQGPDQAESSSTVRPSDDQAMEVEDDVPPAGKRPAKAATESAGGSDSDDSSQEENDDENEDKKDKNDEEEDEDSDEPEE